MAEPLYLLQVTGDECVQGKKYSFNITKEDAFAIQSAWNNRVVNISDGRAIKKTNGEWAEYTREKRGNRTTDQILQSELLSEVAKVIAGDGILVNEDEDEE